MTIHTANASIVVDVNNVHHKWAVVEHHVAMHEGEPPEIIYVSADKLIDVFRFIPGRKNTEWRKIFENGGSVMLRIVYTCDTVTEARQQANLHMKQLPTVPVCNLKGVPMRGRGIAVECVTTKERFPNQARAAEALGIPASGLSRHIKGTLAHVNGLVFREVK